MLHGSSPLTMRFVWVVAKSHAQTPPPAGSAGARAGNSPEQDPSRSAAERGSNEESLEPDPSRSDTGTENESSPPLPGPSPPEFDPLDQILAARLAANAIAQLAPGRNSRASGQLAASRAMVQGADEGEQAARRVEVSLDLALEAFGDEFRALIVDTAPGHVDGLDLVR